MVTVSRNRFMLQPYVVVGTADVEQVESLVALAQRAPGEGAVHRRPGLRTWHAPALGTGATAEISTEAGLCAMAELEAALAHTGGSPDAAQEGGPPGGSVTALVLSNSIGTTQAMWDAQAEALAGDFDIIRYDHRGHGSSPVPRGPYSLADLGGDVLVLLDERGIERTHFCGLSLGGMVGMWLAEYAPERIDRLVLCCTATHMDAGIWAERIASARKAGRVEPLADATMERWFTPRFRAERPEVVARFRAMVARTPVEGYVACAEAIVGMTIEHRLASITAPTLVVAGARDPSTPPEQGEAIAHAIPGARFEIVDAAHMANVEQPDRVTALIREHLAA